MKAIPSSPVGQPRLLRVAVARALMWMGIGASHVRSFHRFCKFCIVGLGGTLVDMGMLYIFADQKMLGLNVSLGKFCAAEIALLNNFLWNELWTFKGRSSGRVPGSGPARRLVVFNMVCGVGIGLAVLLLNLFYTWCGLNLYLSNLLAVGLVTLWNYGLNARFNWRNTDATKPQEQHCVR
jgi:dolichol-phosphate mannosyltransferase